MSEMFEKAARLKIRFNSPRGQLTVEDLWDLPLTSRSGKPNLDDVARDIYMKLHDKGTISFVESARPGDEALQLSLDIVKHVIATLQAEHAEAKAAAEKAERKQKVLAILANRKDEELRGMSTEELERMVSGM